jgi:predicted AlkP superfamily phosphohydrolase/phosphomutase
MPDSSNNINRRDFIKQSVVAAAAFAGVLSPSTVFGSKESTPSGIHRKVVIIGVDGMDPLLCERMMANGNLPNFNKLRQRDGYRRLGTSIPPQSPVAWSNFINGAGPGSHGIFDFIHRDPKRQCAPFFSVADTVSGEGYLKFNDYKLQLDFWPFDHKPPQTVLNRQGVPFWDYLDKAGIESVFYDLPSNYPASPSKYGHHRCLSGMGTPDLLGTYGSYQFFAEDLPKSFMNEGGGKRFKLNFENETAKAELVGPQNSFQKKPEDTRIEFYIHRDKRSRSVAIELGGKKILLKEGQWSGWQKLTYNLKTPAFMPDKLVSGICRFYLQSIDPVCRLYVTPINADPSDPAIKITEPNDFIKNISKDLGLFYTTGFQEDHKALSNGIFSEDEFITQADIVLEERINLLNYALGNYDNGLFYFYFSSTDLQSHMLWWDSDEKHPTRSPDEASYYFSYIKRLYQQMDMVLGKILNRFDNDTQVLVMSDHGFGSFKRQFNLNRWLKENGYLYPPNASSLFSDVDWSKTSAYGLGINSLYLNLKGRELYGSVNPGQPQEDLINELILKLENVRDIDGRPVIRTVHRTDRAYTGEAVNFAPDLVIGYYRPYRASWSTCLGGMEEDILSDNNSAWSADHCADVMEVPGVLFSNRPVNSKTPSLIDLAPSFLTAFGLKVPSSMEGENIFKV